MYNFRLTFEAYLVYSLRFSDFNFQHFTTQAIFRTKMETYNFWT